MARVTKEINYIGVWDGFVENDDEFFKPAESIFIVKDKAERYGIVRKDNSILFPFEYDAITPLGFGLWQIKQRDKVGAIKLCVADDNTIDICWKLPCEYDYMSSENGNLVKASKYGTDGGKDEDFVFLPNLDMMIENSCYEVISWNYYYVEMNPGAESFIINAESGKKYVLEADLILIGSKEVEDVGIYLMFENWRVHDSFIMKISMDGKIKKTENFDDVPTVIYAPDENGMDETRPIAFFAKRQGACVYLDSSLEKREEPLKEVTVSTVLLGTDETDRPVKRLLADYGMKKREGIIGI